MPPNSLPPAVEAAQAWLKAHESELLAEYRALLQIPSLESRAEPNAPFGPENRKALDYMLDLATQAGMATKDLEGYGAYGDFGSGERLVAIFGHLDVVPVGPGWKHEPFGAEIDGDYVYARGAVDDKGPTIAAFYAARALKETCPDLPARIRTFFGCNEESGFKCIERYVQTEEPPTYGIAPDSGWPCYYGEKGIAVMVVEVPLIRGEMSMVEFQGGQRPNIVIDHAEAKVRVSAQVRGEVENKLADAWDNNLGFDWAGDELQIRARGKAAHGSTPYYGDSAAIRILRFLAEIAPVVDRRAYETLFETAKPNGAGIGIDGRDDVSQDLTCNLGIVETVAGTLRMTFNPRYPVTWDGTAMLARCEAHLAKLEGGYRLAESHLSQPLYFPLDHPLTRIVCEVYESETGEKREPGVMGGGTYARAVPNTISIGTGWDGDGDAHQTDERLKVAHLYKMSRIYAHILYRLATE